MLDCNIDRYNVIIHLSKEPLSSIGKANALDGKCSWHLSSASLIPDWLQKQLVDKCTLIRRCREELDLCIDEMRLYLLFYGQKWTNLDRDCHDISLRITGLQHGDSVQTITEDFNLHYTSEDMKGIFFIEEVHVLSVIVGLRSLRRKDSQLCATRLSYAITVFMKVLGSRFESLLLDDEVRRVLADSACGSKEEFRPQLDPQIDTLDYFDVEHSSQEGNDEEDEEIDEEDGEIDEEDVEDSIVNTLNS